MIASVSSLNASTPAAAPLAPSRAQSGAEMQDRFLKLLVAQLNNQDPMNPMDNAQMTSQMAQINTVTGIQKMQQSIELMTGQMQASHSLQGLQMIGRDVLVNGDRLSAQASGVSRIVGQKTSAITAKVNLDAQAPAYDTATNTPAYTTYSSSFDVYNSQGLTQLAARFSVSKLSQDGYAAGNLNSVSIEPDGSVYARYSNGKSQSQGQLVLAKFNNSQGLVSTVGGNWIESPSSGKPVKGTPSSENFGSLQSGSLEESNVDLTAELVNMMTAQRAYQANAQTLKTQDQVMSTLVNLR
eukprot:gene1029-1009_t